MARVNRTRQGLELISDKWTVLVMYDLKSGTKRLSEMHREIEGISQKMLIQTLRKLERHGLVHRTVYPVVPPQVEYSLLPLGETLIAPLLELCVWTASHADELDEACQRYDAREN